MQEVPNYWSAFSK